MDKFADMTKNPQEQEFVICRIRKSLDLEEVPSTPCVSLSSNKAEDAPQALLKRQSITMILISFLILMKAIIPLLLVNIVLKFVLRRARDLLLQFSESFSRASFEACLFMLQLTLPVEFPVKTFQSEFSEASMFPKGRNPKRSQKSLRDISRGLQV